MTGDGFELWLGQIAQERPFRHQVHKALSLAGGARGSSGNRAHRFNGSRIGRGFAIGRILGTSDRHLGSRSRRVVVKVRIVRLRSNGAASAAHLRYLQRDGTTRDGERGTLYSDRVDDADGHAFLQRGREDRHHFRIVVSPEDGAEYDELKPMIRRLMAQTERDLETKLDWVGIDHFNTGHPHCHILVGGKDDAGNNLIIAPEYVTIGLRVRATDLVNLDLGPRSDLEMMRAELREMEQERFTGVDRRLLQAMAPDGLVSASDFGGVEQSLRAGRLATLSRMGLAKEEGKGSWQLSDKLELTLRDMAKRVEIIATLDREVRSRGLAVSRADYAIYDPFSPGAQPIAGRVAAQGLSNEHSGREYLIVEGIDGRTHYVEIGFAGGEQDLLNAIVNISPTRASVHDVDISVAKIAAANHGRYSEEIHRLHDPNASEAFVQTHVNRLEDLQRSSGAVERGTDGIWNIALDHLEQALHYECRYANREPVQIERLTSMALEQMPAHDGITWLDEDASLLQARGRSGSFGRKVADAMQRRQQWLIEQGLADKPDTLEILRRRELQRVADQISHELGSYFVKPQPGCAVEGTYRRSVHVGATRMAVIENSREFTLVPWRSVLERQFGKEVSGIVRPKGVSRIFGRQRSAPEI
ncbi:MAG TPA: DUF3363 domain-containing protein [Sphingomicrobium sp.]|nr:DUF3363 domain-containing protein [Sphingomicrobium sp.]